MKIGYIQKPYAYGEDGEFTSETVEFLTEEQYEKRNMWDTTRYIRIVYEELD